MTLWEMFKSRFDKDNKQFISFPLDSSRTADKPPAVTIQAGKTYFRLRLGSVFLHKRVEGGKSWYPAVHSLVQFAFADQPKVDVPNIVDPTIGGQKTGETLLRDVTLTPAMPFSGGTVSVNVGLMAMEEENHIAGFIKVFGLFAEQLAVPQLSSAIKIAQPLASGIQELFGMGNGRLHLGLKQDFAGGELTQGYVVLIRAAEKDVDKSKLWVRDLQLREGPTLDKSEPFDKFDYMLLRVEVLTDRDDWNKLTFIDEPFQQALDALQGGDEEAQKKADLFMQTALRRVLKSPDLTQADRTRVMALLKEQYKSAKENLRGLAGKDLTLQAIMKRPAISAAAALELPEPTLDDVVNL
jgi:hypothetical protein